MGAPTGVLASNFGLSYGLEWAGVVLLIAFFVRYLRPPLKRMMSAQKARIQASLEAGNEARASAEKAVEDGRASVAAARREADSLLEQARNGADRFLEEARRRAEDDYARLVGRAESDIALERARIRSEINEEVSSLVLAFTARMVDAELDGEGQHRLFGEVIDAAEAEAS